MNSPSEGKIGHWGVAAFLVLALLGSGLLIHVLVGQTRANDDTGGVESVQQPTRTAINNGVVVLTLDQEGQQNAGIVSARLNPAPDEYSVLGFGDVLDPGPLAAARSEYQDAAARVDAAGARFAATQTAFARADTLYSNGQIVSKAQSESAQAILNIAKAAVTAARIHLITAKVAVQEAWGSVLAAAVTSRASLITDLLQQRDYLIKVNLPSNVDATSPPVSAVVVLPDGTKVKLAYISLANAADPKLGGISYFYLAPAREGLLPGLNVEVSLAWKTSAQGLVVPNSAVVWLHGQAWIYIRTSRMTFTRHKIDSNRPAENDGYVVTGLHADDQVVVLGAAMLLSEEFRSQLPEDRT